MNFLKTKKRHTHITLKKFWKTVLFPLVDESQIIFVAFCMIDACDPEPTT